MPGTSIFGRAARLTVTPPPTTLSDSLCILKSLRVFGSVTSFLNPRYAPAVSQSSTRTGRDEAVFLAIFKSPDALTSAIDATPLTIETGLDQPDPKDEDPYNVRGLQDRERISRKSFRCSVSLDTDAEARHTASIDQNAYHGSFIVDQASLVYQDLTHLGAPVEGLATVHSREHPLQQIPTFRKEAGLGRRDPSLDRIHAQVASRRPSSFSQSVMAIYQEAMQKRAQGFVPAGGNAEKLRVIAKAKKAEKMRQSRQRWAEHKQRKWATVKARQAEMDQELMGTLQRMAAEKEERSRANEMEEGGQGESKMEAETKVTDERRAW